MTFVGVKRVNVLVDVTSKDLRYKYDFVTPELQDDYLAAMTAIKLPSVIQAKVAISIMCDKKEEEGSLDDATASMKAWEERLEARLLSTE